MAGYAEKVQHLQRCSLHNIPQPRVVRAIAWQPWAIKSTTLTALRRAYWYIICSVIYLDINENVSQLNH